MKKYTLLWILILCLILVGIPSHVAASFPTKHPDTAFSSTFAKGYGSSIDQFNIYVWRENNSVWIEIEPIEQDAPFICSSAFSIIQNEVQFDTVKLVPVSGNSQYRNVHITSVFELSQWLFFDNPADLNSEFTLLFDGGENTYTLDIFNKPPTVITDSATSVTSSSATLNGTVNPNRSNTTYYFEYGVDMNYGLITEIMNAGSGTAAVLVNVTISDLKPDDIYHYRVRATNNFGTSYGSNRMFYAGE
jgi:hypothetical protein